MNAVNFVNQQSTINNHRPVITGLGLITPLGKTVHQTWDALLAGRCITDHAKVAQFESDATKLAVCAARQAVAQSNWNSDVCADPGTALITGTSKGPISEWFAGPCPQMIEGLAHTGNCVARELGFLHGPQSTVSAACASGLQAMAMAAMLIASGQARRALVVAVEASVHPMFISSFQRLGVIAPPRHGCRPFDRNRRGFLMSEAAAAVCLEATDDPIGRPLARIDRCALGGDAAHLTAADPDGTTLRRLLRQVIHGESVDLIHAHGTGTIINDPIELSAIESAITQPTIAYSHKAALGHSLGASGLLSIVLNCVAHRTGVVPPNIQTTDPLPTRQLTISSEVVKSPIRRSITTATGFGGPAAVMGLVSM